MERVRRSVITLDYTQLRSYSQIQILILSHNPQIYLQFVIQTVLKTTFKTVYLTNLNKIYLKKIFLLSGDGGGKITKQELSKHFNNKIKINITLLKKCRIRHFFVS